jgi:DNA-binding response OmpR family regulator
VNEQNAAATPLGVGSAGFDQIATGGAVSPGGEVLLLVPGGWDREGTAAMLASGGFLVRTGAPDAATLELALRDPPGLLLADLEPDEAEAIRFRRRLEERLGGFAPPLVLLSSRDDEAALRRAFDAGVRDVLAKPLSAALLRVKARQLLRPPAGARGFVGPYRLRGLLGRGGMAT